ncbi:MAG: hypothetical protein M1269_05590 [Chloroflexi bacterium]|nr:hypothetical protein [Chloroflexota bacterium]
MEFYFSIIDIIEHSFILFVAGIISALASGIIAYKRRRSFIGFFFVGLILNLPGILITYFVAAREYSAEPENKEYLELKPVHLSLASLFVTGFATLSLYITIQLLQKFAATLIPLFEGMNMALPQSTQIIFSASRFTDKYWFLIMFIWLVLLYIYFKWVHLVSVKKRLAITIKKHVIVFIIVFVFFYLIVLPFITWSTWLPLYIPTETLH